MRVLIVGMAVIISLAPKPCAHKAPPRQQDSQITQEQASTNRNSAEKDAIIAGALPPQQTDTKTPSTQPQGNNKASDANWWMVGLTSIYCLVAALQLIVFGIQAKRLGQTIRKMDEIAGMEMRAYITVIIGGAGYQEREKNIKFGGMPVILNSGRTPAYKLSYIMRCSILPTPLPADFQLPPLPKKNTRETEFIVAQQQGNVSLTDGAIVDEFVPDQDVEAIKKQTSGKALYAWGIITYEDIFGTSHSTEFCQSYVWLPDGKIFGFYTPGRNRAT